MDQSDPEASLAEAGIALAMARDAHDCCTMLQTWTLRLTRAAAAGVTYSGELGSVTVGSLPEGLEPDAQPRGGELAERRLQRLGFATLHKL